MMNAAQCLTFLALSLMLVSEVSAIRSDDIFSIEHRAGRRLSTACSTCSSALASAINFGILGASKDTNSGASNVTGDCGVYPGTSLAGFVPNGQGKCSAYHSADTVSQQAKFDAKAAFDSLNLMTGTDLTGQDLGNRTLAAGVYSFSSEGPLNGVLTLDAQTNTSAQFIIKTVSTFNMGANSSVVLANGAQACNVFFLVGSSSTLGPNCSMNGNILANIQVDVGFSSNVAGTIVAFNAAVNLDTNNIAAQNTCPTTPAQTAAVTSLLRRRML